MAAHLFSIVFLCTLTLITRGVPKKEIRVTKQGKPAHKRSTIANTLKKLTWLLWSTKSSRVGFTLQTKRKFSCFQNITPTRSFVSFQKSRVGFCFWTVSDFQQVKATRLPPRHHPRRLCRWNAPQILNSSSCLRLSRVTKTPTNTMIL